MKLSRTKISQLIGLAVFAAGVATMAPFAYMWHQNHQALAQASHALQVPAKAPLPAPKPTLVTGKPVRLQIPSLGFNLQVIDGAYNSKNGTWTLTLNKAQYALPSVQPNNEAGNTLIYGHYRPEVFAYLHLIKPGAQAYVLTDNGYRFKYIYQSTKAFDPTDTSIFMYQGVPRLTIQTCSGVYFQNRQMYYFSFDSVDKV